MSIIKIAHWEDAVGEENLREFTQITREIYYATRNGQTLNGVLEKAEKKAPGAEERWKRAAGRMKWCGLEQIDNLWYIRGWLVSPVIIGDTLRFPFFAREYSRSSIALQYVPYKKIREMITLLEVQDPEENWPSVAQIEGQAWRGIGSKSAPRQGKLIVEDDDEGGILVE